MAHREEPTNATERRKWNMEHAKTKQKAVNTKRKQLKDFDLNSAFDRYIAERDGNKDVQLKFGEQKETVKPEEEDQFTPIVNDEFGSLLQTAINTLRKDPNDFHSQIAVKGMNLFYEWDSLKIVNEEKGEGSTYVNFEPGELDDEGKLVNTVDNNDDDGSLNNTDILDTNPDTERNPISTEYQRPSPSERHKRRMEDILVRGRPGARFKLEKERNDNKMPGTDIKNLFKKNIEDE